MSTISHTRTFARYYKNTKISRTNTEFTLKFKYEIEEIREGNKENIINQDKRM